MRPLPSNTALAAITTRLLGGDSCCARAQTRRAAKKHKMSFTDRMPDPASVRPADTGCSLTQEAPAAPMSIEEEGRRESLPSDCLPFELVLVPERNLNVRDRRLSGVSAHGVVVIQSGNVERRATSLRDFQIDFDISCVNARSTFT